MYLVEINNNWAILLLLSNENIELLKFFLVDTKEDFF